MTQQTLSPAIRGKLLVVCTALMSTGCGDGIGPEESFGHLDQAIVNGSLDNGDPAVVAMTAGGQAFCTGTLITPTVVLTAAHCLPPNLGDFGITSYSQIEVFFGSQVNGAGDFIRVAEGWTHSGWNIDVFEDDIGLVRLVSPGPATPIPIASSAMTTADVGAPTRLVGFGVTSDGGSDSGRKRQGTSTIEDVFQFVFTMGLAPSVTCSGDSGGPTLRTKGSQEEVIGIHSRSDCLSQSIDTRVDDYLGDIENFIGNVEPGAQCFADGQCASGCTNVDPDCPCVQDGFCSDLCTDQATDPDCVTSCIADDVCDAECVDIPDPDCDPIEEPTPPAPTRDTWVAGDADEEDYEGIILSSCAQAPGGNTSHPWSLLLAVGLLLGRRRDGLTRGR